MECLLAFAQLFLNKVVDHAWVITLPRLGAFTRTYLRITWRFLRIRGYVVPLGLLKWWEMGAPENGGCNIIRCIYSWIMVLQAQWYGTKLKPRRMKSRSAIPGSIEVLSQLTEICLSESLKLRLWPLFCVSSWRWIGPLLRPASKDHCNLWMLSPSETKTEPDRSLGPWWIL